MAKYYDDYDVKSFYINSLTKNVVKDKYGRKKEVRTTLINGKEFVISNLDEDYKTKYACVPCFNKDKKLTDFVITKCVEIERYDVPGETIPYTEICAFSTMIDGEICSFQTMHVICTFNTFREAEVSCNQLNDIIALINSCSEEDYERSRQEVKCINIAHQAKLNSANANYRSPEDFSRRK